MGDRLRQRALISLACTCALTIGVSATLLAAPATHFDIGARAQDHAVRGTSVSIAPVPPPPLDYPVGTCDHLTEGLPGLALDAAPVDARRIGTSVQGRPIWAEYWGPTNAATTIVIVGQTHGNECSPTLLVDALRRRPPVGYGAWLIPTLNPDGYARYQRVNAADVDLNADGGRASQPETEALFAFLDHIDPDLAVFVHSPNGFLGAYPSNLGTAGSICRNIQARTGVRCSGNGAGTRSDFGRWFLWQGHRSRGGGESLLIEMYAVAASEVPTARPRPATRSVTEVNGDVAEILASFEQLLSS